MDVNGDIMDTFRLEKTAKLLRVNNNIKIAGALIPNNDKAPRIQELKGIATEPDDAIVADFSAYFDNIADLLATQIEGFACSGKKLTFVQVELELTSKLQWPSWVRFPSTGGGSVLAI